MLSFKFLLFLACTIVIAAASPAGEHIVGGVKQLEGDELKDAEETLQLSLTKLSAGPDGPDYKIGKIHSASRQVVSGNLYKIKADLVDNHSGTTKTCDVSIWSQPWLENGIEVTFDCPGEDKVVKKHSA